MKTFLFLLSLAALGTGAFLARSDIWIAPDINRWQASVIGENRYFPVLTAFILALPVLLLVFLLTLLTRNKKRY